MSTQAFNNAIFKENPLTGSKRGHIEVIQSGIDRHSVSSVSKNALKNILGIEGDAVGTLNTQELFNKTTDGGFF
jgi:hypothetical protein